MIGDGDGDFDSELATAECDGNLPELIASAAKHMVGDQHGTLAFQSPNPAAMRAIALPRIDAFREHVLLPLSPCQLFGGAKPPPAKRPWLLRVFPAASSLSLLLSLHEKRLIEALGRSASDPLFELIDTLASSLQFGRLPQVELLQRDDYLDQSEGINPPLPHILFELLNIHAPVIIDPMKSHSGIFKELTGTLAGLGWQCVILVVHATWGCLARQNVSAGEARGQLRGEMITRPTAHIGRAACV